MTSSDGCEQALCLEPNSNPNSYSYQALNSKYPKAWWIVALSADVKKGRVTPLQILERDLVLWRDRESILYCQSAHCPHLGAHLGYGGEVIDDAIRCPFHGWCFSASGALVAQAEPDRLRKGIRLLNYRIIERYGVVFLWNGTGEPDFDLPDVLSYFNVTEDRIFTSVNRYHLPFPAKWFAENVCDGMHLAIAHGAAEWGDAFVINESPTRVEIENRLHNPRRWFTWQNVKRLYLRRELRSLFTPVSSTMIWSSYGGVLHFGQVPPFGSLGNHFLCWTPIDSHSHYVTIVDVLPRLRIPVVGPVVQRLLAFAVALGESQVILQDATIMVHRQEPPSPPYASSDRGLVGFRRHWDSRIEGTEALAGDGIRSNGARAGIRVKGREGSHS